MVNRRLTQNISRPTGGWRETKTARRHTAIPTHVGIDLKLSENSTEYGFEP